MTNDNPALDALDRIENDNNVYVRDLAHDDEIEGFFKIVRDYITRPQPCGDAVKALDGVLKSYGHEIECLEGIKRTQFGDDMLHTYKKFIEELELVKAALTKPRVDVEGVKNACDIIEFVIAPVSKDKDCLIANIQFIRKHLAAQGYIGVPEWQPIETAPRDGEYFLVCLPRMMNLIIRARFDRVHKQWLSDRDNDGVIFRVEFFRAGDFWMPMPKPPAAPKNEG